MDQTLPQHFYLDHLHYYTLVVEWLNKANTKTENQSSICWPNSFFYSGIIIYYIVCSLSGCCITKEEGIPKLYYLG